MYEIGALISLTTVYRAPCVLGFANRRVFYDALGLSKGLTYLTQDGKCMHRTFPSVDVLVPNRSAVHDNLNNNTEVSYLILTHRYRYTGTNVGKIKHSY